MSRDTSFYYSFLVLPPRKRSAILAVWDFCRAVDDAVDEVVPETEWQRRADAGGAGPRRRVACAPGATSWTDLRRHPAHAAGHGAAAVGVASSTCRKREFNSLIDGVEMDLSHAQVPDFEALADLLPQGGVERRPDLRGDLRLPRSAPRAITPSTSGWRCSSPTSSVTWPPT